MSERVANSPRQEKGQYMWYATPESIISRQFGPEEFLSDITFAGWCPGLYSDRGPTEGYVRDLLALQEGLRPLLVAATDNAPVNVSEGERLRLRTLWGTVMNCVGAR